MRKQPPRLAQLLAAMTSPAGPSRDGLLGDLCEGYSERCESQGWLRAYLWYWYQALFAALRATRPNAPVTGLKPAGTVAEALTSMVVAEIMVTGAISTAAPARESPTWENPCCKTWPTRCDS